MYRPLPAPEPSELVNIYQDFRGVQKRCVHGARSMFSLPEYRVYRDGSRTLSGVTAYTKSWTVTLGGRFPQEVEGVLVACNYFDVLRLPMIEQLTSLPGIRAVAQVSKVPLSPGRSQGTFRLPAQEQTHEFDVNAVSPDYFAVLGLPIVRGRTFTRAELEGGAGAAIVPRRPPDASGPVRILSVERSLQRRALKQCWRSSASYEMPTSPTWRTPNPPTCIWQQGHLSRGV
jgi:hypothetical protein